MKAVLATILVCIILALSLDAHDINAPMKSATYYSSGHLQKFRLLEPTEIQGISCENWVILFENGRIQQAQLNQDTRFNETVLPASTTIFLSESGMLSHCWLSQNLTIQGLPCAGDAPKAATGFYPNGNISYCFLTRDTVILGLPCKASLLGIVRLYESGTLKECMLSKATMIEGRVYPAETSVVFDPNGTVRSSHRLPMYKRLLFKALIPLIKLL